MRAKKISGVNLDVIELDERLRQALRQQGYHVVGNDFLTHKGTQYDRIIMNPPFSKKGGPEPQSVMHIKHAYSMLKPGGKMAAILPDWIFRANKGRLQIDIIQWLKDETGVHTTYALARGTFDNDESSTQVPTRILLISKPGIAKKGKKQSKRTKFGNSLDLMA